jgi:hypothetical protein
VRKLLIRAGVVTAAGTAIVLVGAGLALAAGTYTAFPDPAQGQTYNIVGSETLADVFGGLTQGFTYNGNNYTADAFGATVGSWNAVNPNNGDFYDNITPVVGCDTFPRPNGSGDGRNALSAAWNPNDDQFTENGGNVTLSSGAACKEQEISASRASSLPSYSLWTQNVGAANNDLTAVPLAIDAVGVAEQVNGTAIEASNFTTAALTAAYTGGSTNTAPPYAIGEVVEAAGQGTGTGCSTHDNPYYVTGVNTRTGAITSESQIIPVLPQASSGTRQFFLSAINATSFDAADVANETGAVAQEENNAKNDLSTTDVGNALANNSPDCSVPANSIEIVPFSGGQLIEQLHGFKTSTLGTADFPTINSDTLYNGKSGVNAAIGTLQTSELPDITYNDSDGKLVGDFVRYLWGTLPSSEVTTAGPTHETGMQKWLDQTIPVAKDSGGNSVWSDFGFDPITTATSDNSADWITFEWTN